MSASTNGNNDDMFSQAAGAGISFGYGFFPRIAIAKRNIKDLRTRYVALELELGRVLESSLASLKEEKERAANNDENVRLAEEIVASNMRAGNASVKDMLEYMDKVSNTKVTGITSRMSIAGHRVTLKRITMEDQFLDVLVNSIRQLRLGGLDQAEKETLHTGVYAD
jgi:hypothetical protein